MAEKNAKEALTRKIFESETNNKLLNEVADKFELDISPRMIRFMTIATFKDLILLER